MKPVKLTGRFDHNKEYQVAKSYRNEKGFQVITPFYTHLDGNNKPAAIFVNRGWLPADLANARVHYLANSTEVSGYLYRGDVEHKYGKANNPMSEEWHTARLNEFALVSQLPNEEEASKFALM